MILITTHLEVTSNFKKQQKAVKMRRENNQEAIKHDREEFKGDGEKFMGNGSTIVLT